jgi:sulfocyanin
MAPLLTSASAALLLVTGTAQAQIDTSWLRVDAAAKRVEFKLVAGLTGLNAGMNFNGFAQGKLALTVPQGWSVVLHFTNQDQNLPHSAEVIADAKSLPIGPVAPVFERATSGKLEQGFGGGESHDIRFQADTAGSYLIFCAVPGHGAAGMWIRFTVSATANTPTLAAMP